MAMRYLLEPSQRVGVLQAILEGECGASAEGVTPRERVGKDSLS